MAGLVQAIHAASRRRTNLVSARPIATVCKGEVFSFSGCLRTLDAPSHVDGRIQPAMTP
jgi:hypothetical protein